MSQKKSYNPGELLGHSTPDTAQTVGKPSAESVAPNGIVANKFKDVNKNIDFGKLKYRIDDLNTIINKFYEDLPTGSRKAIIFIIKLFSSTEFLICNCFLFRIVLSVEFIEFSKAYGFPE